MQQNTINNYLNPASLFRAAKPASFHMAKSQTMNKSYTPTRSQYTPANPNNFKVKQTLLCKTCQDKKNSAYVRESKKLDELYGIERDLQNRNVAVVNQPIVQEQHRVGSPFKEGTRPPNYVFESHKHPIYISKTVEMNQNRAYVLQKTVPSVIERKEDQSPRIVEPFILPIKQQKSQQQASKHENILLSQHEVLNTQKSQQSKVQILINNEKLNVSPQPENIMAKEKGNIQTNNYFITRTQSDYLSQPDQKEVELKEVKKWSQLQVSNKGTPISNISENQRVQASRGGSNFQKIVHHSIDSKNSETEIVAQKQIVPNSTRRKQVHNYFAEQTDRDDFFHSTKRDTNKYIENIKNRLKQSYRSLEQIQTQIDGLIQKNLEAECQKIKINLYKVIDLQLKEFKENERKKLSNTKFSYMSDLYELKCNIDLRLQELQDYQLAFGSQHKWKYVVNDLLTPDYESTIQFLVSKSAETQEESIVYTENFLAEYNNKMFIEVLQPLKKEMKISIENLFANFTRMRQKRIGYQTFIDKYFEEEKITI